MIAITRRLKFLWDSLTCWRPFTVRPRGPGDPTRDWTRDPDLEIVVDLDKGAICGVGTGDSFEQLSGLGPADSCQLVGMSEGHGRLFRKIEYFHDLKYFDLGLSMMCTPDNKLQWFFLLLGGDDEPRMEPFNGILRCNCAPVDLTRSTTEAPVIEGLGRPDGGRLEYHYGNVWVSVILDSGGKLSLVSVVRIEAPAEPA